MAVMLMASFAGAMLMRIAPGFSSDDQELNFGLSAQSIQAIRKAESKTSGEIRVLIQRGKLNSDPFVAAQKKFHRLGMHKTRERNAVLIFVAPRVHKFAVIGDEAIHKKCGDQFWQRVVEKMRTHFQNEKFSDALIEAVEEIGEVLASDFPKTREDTNELPDNVIET